MKFIKKSLIFVILFSVFLFVGCDNKGKHIHEYEDNKTYYLVNEGNDYYTQKCKHDNHIKKTEMEEQYDLESLLEEIVTGEKIIIDRDINKDTNDQKTYIITKSIVIEGNDKPKIYGNFRIELDNGEVNPVTIKNLEIIHNGLFQYDLNNKPMINKDERRGIVVINGGVNLQDNYIHLLDENPSQRLYSASTGIQIGVSEENGYSEQYRYVISNNRIGKYARSQTTSSSEPTGILLVDDVEAKLNLTEEEINNIYTNNTFDEGTECFLAAFDYETYEYNAGFFSTLEIAKSFVGNNNEYLGNNRSLIQDNEIYKIVINQ